MIIGDSRIFPILATETDTIHKGKAFIDTNQLLYFAKNIFRRVARVHITVTSSI